MNIKLSRALCATTALATGLLLSSQALAQSTGTAIVEEMVVTGSRGPANLGGAIVAIEEPKSRAAITSEFIARQVPGQSVLDTINLLPAVNFTNNDAYGSSGGDIVIRGVDGQRIALLQDGVPLNDSGNYAVYPNQQLEPDLIERVTVNLGTTDVDSPTAAAAGGTINYITKRASEEFGVRAEVGFGSEDMQRYYATVESGAFGPFGTKLWVSGMYQKYDHFRPINSPIDAPGGIEKTQFNARVDQDFGDIGQASLIFHYNENRNHFINRINLPTFQRQGLAANGSPDLSMVAPSVCLRPTPGAGAQNDNTGAFTCPSNFYEYSINPSDTGNIRGLSSWNLTDQLTLTVDPSFQYVLANGGGAQIFPETDLQLRGNSTAAGVDLNGDGDIADRVYLYRPNTTNTRRYSVTSSLIWKFADNQSVRVAYTYDRAKHRQTGDVGYIGQDGVPENVFGGKDGQGRLVALPDGTNLRRRDRLSIAELNQVSAEWRGRFLDDKLLLNVGVRAPFFRRELNNYCYQENTFNAYCTTQVGTPIPGTEALTGDGKPLVTFPLATLNSNATFRYGQPRSFTKKYDDVLPNVGASYEITSDWSVYGSYAETISVPRTDDLYDRVVVDPQPETTKTFDVGIRYQTPAVQMSAAVWTTDFKNRIERVLDEASNVSFSQNIGDVDYKGFDFEAGWKPADEFFFYVSYSYIDSEIQQDIRESGAPRPTKGKQMYETPKHQGAARVQYDPVEWLSLGAQVKFVGDRYTNLINTETFRGYQLVDFDVRFNISELANFEGMGVKNTYLQLNVKNAFNERYLGDITPSISTATALGQPGYRRAITATLHAEF